MAWAAANGCYALLCDLVGAMSSAMTNIRGGASAERKRHRLIKQAAHKLTNRAQRGRRFRRVAVNKSKWAKRGPGMLVAQRRPLT